MAKQVTDPLNDRVKARLSDLVHAFFEIDDADTANAPDSDAIIDVKDGDVAGCDDDDVDNSIHVVEMIRDVLSPKSDPFRLRLVSDASVVSEALEGIRSGSSGYRRVVMARLREAGYNAGICKARWESCGGLTAGSYEYIDVEEKASRYIVDLDFASQFEVARVTPEYEKVLAALPRVLVGKPEEVQQVVRVATQAGRRSLRSRGLSVPPWRKVRYMLAKWLGPYRRTVNTLPSSAGALGGGGGDGEAKCRAVGFRPASWTGLASWKAGGMSSGVAFIDFGACGKQPKQPKMGN